MRSKRRPSPTVLLARQFLIDEKETGSPSSVWTAAWTSVARSSPADPNTVTTASVIDRQTRRVASTRATGESATGPSAARSAKRASSAPRSCFEPCPTRPITRFPMEKGFAECLDAPPRERTASRKQNGNGFGGVCGLMPAELFGAFPARVIGYSSRLDCPDARVETLWGEAPISAQGRGHR